MDFKHDLLLIDLEMTGLDSTRHEIIQLAGILLDKKTLKEIKVFNYFVKPARFKNRDPKSMAVNKIKLGQLQNSPSITAVIKHFNKAFNPKEVILTFYGGLLDMDFLRLAYKKAKVKWEFDYHYFNLWAFFYGFLAAKNQLKNSKKFTGFTLDELMKKHKVNVSGARHDGLFDCRVEAEVLRKIIKK